MSPEIKLKKYNHFLHNLQRFLYRNVLRQPPSERGAGQHEETAGRPAGQPRRHGPGADGPPALCWRWTESDSDRGTRELVDTCTW